MGIRRNSFTKRTQYTVSYTNMHGVDFSAYGDLGTRTRYAYLENMYRDYDGAGAGVTESIPGYRKLVSLGDKVHSIYSHKDTDGRVFVVVHAGRKLYRFALDERDSIGALSPIATLEDNKSRGFTFGSDLYILDGKDITKICADGSAVKAGHASKAPVYVPTTYHNGKEYEQRNLLTPLFYERTVINSAEDFRLASDGLKYSIISAEGALCEVSGISDDAAGAVSVPAYVTIGSQRYSVVKIADGAFSGNKKITEVHLSHSCKIIGRGAFKGCTSLKSLYTAESISAIDEEAICSCPALEKIFLGGALAQIGTSNFTGCQALKAIDYGGTEESFLSIDCDADLSPFTVNHYAQNKSISVEIFLNDPATSVIVVKKNGFSVEHRTKVKDGIIRSVIIDTEDKDELSGADILIFANLSDTKYSLNSIGQNFIAGNGDISPKEAILGCTVCENFDGRVFLSGNPKLPNTVFYSSRDLSGKNNPMYFGVMNYFNDGTGSYGVTSLLATGESLAVFKAGDDGGGSIYYHTPKETDISILPKIYPVTYVHSGISGMGESISFFDDPVFISALGVSALDKKTINLERSVCCRSHNVNARLLSEDLSSVSLAKWCGYLVVAAGSRFYLADSRDTFVHSTGNMEYEWYFLAGIGSYSDDSYCYVYASYAPEGYDVHPEPGKKLYTGSFMKETDSLGNPVICQYKDGKKYVVHKTEEQVLGSFHSASCIHAIDDVLLFFGTENGDVCIFNNDKRGVAPPTLSAKPDFDPEEYSRAYGTKIHPYYYSFMLHAPRYALKTTTDDGGFAHMAKDSVKNSLAIKIRSFGAGHITCETGTDKSGYKEICDLPDFAFSFDELDFSCLSFDNPDFITMPINEREKNWVEKQLCVYSDTYTSPFGIASMTYRFSVRGKIKRN